MIGKFKKFQKAILFTQKVATNLENGSLQLPRGQWLCSIGRWSRGRTMHRYDGLYRDVNGSLWVQLMDHSGFLERGLVGRRIRREEHAKIIASFKHAPVLATGRAFNAAERACLKPTALYLVAQFCMAWVM